MCETSIRTALNIVDLPLLYSVSQTQSSLLTIEIIVVYVNLTYYLIIVSPIFILFYFLTAIALYYTGHQHTHIHRYIID